MNVEIVYEDTDLLVLSKPAGVVVNEAQTLSEPTLQQWARDHIKKWTQENPEWQALVPTDFDDSYGSPEQIFQVRAGMVHRIDRDTSGIVVWAKNPGCLANLLAQFKNRVVEKTYTALAHGTVDSTEGEITAPIDRIPWKRGLFGVMAAGRPAITEYVVRQTLNLDKEMFIHRAKAAGLFKGQSAEQVFAQQADYFQYSLVDCHPKTGRTHQIRVHFQHIHHPLAGDALYQGGKRYKLDKLWCPRHFLHAAAITFVHPKTGERTSVEAPMPEDLITVLSYFQHD